MPHSLVNQIPVRRFRLHHRDQADAGRGSTRAALWSLPLPWTAHSPRGASRSSAIGDGASVPVVATGRGAREPVWIGPARRHGVSVWAVGRLGLFASGATSESHPGQRSPDWRRRAPHRAGQSISVSTLKRGRDGTRTTTTCSSALMCYEQGAITDPAPAGRKVAERGGSDFDARRRTLPITAGCRAV
jgi:hypothetical protein